MKIIKGRIILLLLLLLIWFLLTYPFNIQEALAGLVVAILILIIPLPGADIYSDLRLSPKALLNLVLFIFVFLYSLVKSNFDVAFRVLSPKLPIKPGVVKVKTKLKTRLGRLLLANAITLTPGTITVETKDEFFYIHWIYVKDKDIDAASRKIVGSFEKYLEVACG